MGTSRAKVGRTTRKRRNITEVHYVAALVGYSEMLGNGCPNPGRIIFKEAVEFPDPLPRDRDIPADGLGHGSEFFLNDRFQFFHHQYSIYLIEEFFDGLIRKRI